MIMAGHSVTPTAMHGKQWRTA